MTREQYIPPCFQKTVTQADHIQAGVKEVKKIHQYRNQRAAVEVHTISPTWHLIFNGKISTVSLFLFGRKFCFRQRHSTVQFCFRDQYFCPLDATQLEIDPGIPRTLNIINQFCSRVFVNGSHPINVLITPIWS